MKCALCGFEYDENAPEVQQKCKSCPLGKLCKMLCCPRCGYTMPMTRKKKAAKSKNDR